MEGQRISILKEINDDKAVELSDAQLMFLKIVNVLEEEGHLVLDFSNLSLITPTFLNIMIGQLYSLYDSHFLREHLKVENLTKEDIAVLKRVTDNAKKYFEQKEVNLET